MIPGNVARLGKLPHREDARTLTLARYLDAAKLPPIPPAIDWGAKVGAWGAMLNTEIGDCAVAALGHCVQLWTQNEGGAEVTIPDAEILAAYESIAGYRPGDPASDVGCVELDCLNHFRRVGIGGYRIGAFALVARAGHGTAADAAWIDHVRAAIALLGTAYIGLEMPLAWQSTMTWLVPRGGPHGEGAKNSWGGHAVMLRGFRPAPAAHGGWEFLGISWGEPFTISANALLTFCDETWAILSPQWVDGTRPAPSGLDLASLQRDLASLGSRR